MSEFFFILNNSFALLITFFVSDFLFKDSTPLRRSIAAIAGFPIVALLAVLLLGTFDLLSALGVALLLGFIVVVLAVIWGRLRNYKSVGCLQNPLWFDYLSRRRASSIFALIIVGVCGGLIIGMFILDGTYFGLDDLSYHTSVTVPWLKQGDLNAMSVHAQSYFPLNAEVFSLWFMLPFGTDGFVMLAGIYWFGLAALVVIALAIEQGVGNLLAILAGIWVLSSNVVIRQWRSFTAVDLASAVMVLICLLFAVPSSDDEKEGGLYGSAAMCGLAFGFALGCKVNALSVGLIVFLWLLISNRKTLTLTTRLRRTLTFSVCAMVTGSYWYVRNISLTGNPLFPAEVGPFAGPFLSEHISHTKLMAFILDSPGSKIMWLKIFKTLVNWPLPLYVISFLGFTTAIVSVLSQMKRLSPKAKSIQRLLLLCGVATLLMYPIMPFSGSTVNHDTMRLALRFILLPFLIGWVLFLPLLSSGGRAGWFWRLIYIALLVTGWLWIRNSLLVGVGVVIAIVLLNVLPSARKWIEDFKLPRPAVCSIFLFLLPAVLIGLSFGYSRQQVKTDRRILGWGLPMPDGTRFEIGKAWKATEQLPDGANLAYVTPYALMYPFHGRRLQFDLCFGIFPRTPLHELWRENPNFTVWCHGVGGGITKVLTRR